MRRLFVSSTAAVAEGVAYDDMELVCLAMARKEETFEDHDIIECEDIDGTPHLIIVASGNLVATKTFSEVSEAVHHIAASITRKTPP